MRCLNVNGGSGEQTFSQSFTLAKGNCNDNYGTVGCDTFKFEWNQGCYGINGRGYGLSTSDLDQDAWTSGGASPFSCATQDVSHSESGGWGWHKSCGCGGLYKNNGQPMCMGAGDAGNGYSTNGADRVEMWLMVT
jgi:hypothetical protein